MDASACLASGGGGDRDVDWALDWIEELPENGCRDVAQDRALAAGEDGGREAGVEVRGAVAHGVDALVEAVEVTIASRLGNRVLADADLT